MEDDEGKLAVEKLFEFSNSKAIKSFIELYLDSLQSTTLTQAALDEADSQHEEDAYVLGLLLKSASDALKSVLVLRTEAVRNYTRLKNLEQ